MNRSGVGRESKGRWGSTKLDKLKSVERERAKVGGGIEERGGGGGGIGT